MQNVHMILTKHVREQEKSNGKVDMVVSLINAIYLLEQDYFLNEGDFTFQMI